MLSVERHPNLDNWFEVRAFGKMLDQFTSAVRAIQFAKKIQKQKKIDSIYINIKREYDED